MTLTKGTAELTLPSPTQILLTREFAAPPAAVYRVFTEPGFIMRWWAGKQGTMTAAEVDLRVGGTWRYAMTAAGGFEVAFRGVFREVVPAERFVCTQIYQAGPGATDEEPGVLVTYTFAPSDAGTTVSVLTDVPDQETRDAIVATGMEAGVQDGWDIAEELAAGLAAH